MRFNLIKKYALMGLLLLLSFASQAEKREIALTIDDLPFVGESQNFHLNMILDTIKGYAIPVTGFIIAKEVNARNLPMLRKLHDAGFGLGNHTLSHLSADKVNSAEYIQEIAVADKILSPVLTAPKYFRFPYMATGHGNKKTKIMEYLSSQNYQVAPITVDSKDFMFNQLLLAVTENKRRQFLSVLKRCYLDFIWQQTLKAEEHNRLIHKPDQAQILLIHANLLNAYVLPDIINLYRENGFSFVSLADALKTAGAEQAKPATKKFKDYLKPENYLAWD